jgi:hypothetical protein
LSVAAISWNKITATPRSAHGCRRGHDSLMSSRFAIVPINASTDEGLQ